MLPDIDRSGILETKTEKGGNAMISAIVYASNSGFTARYAKMLGKATGQPVIDWYSAHK